MADPTAEVLEDGRCLCGRPYPTELIGSPADLSGKLDQVLTGQDVQARELLSINGRLAQLEPLVAIALALKDHPMAAAMLGGNGAGVGSSRGG